MRERVLKVAEELGYDLEQHPARVKAQRTRVLGLIHPDMSNPFYSDLSAGAIDAARAEGYEVFLAHTQENSETLASITSAMIARNVDGIIFTVLHPDDGERIRELRRASIPFIQVSRRIPNLRADWVGVDDVAGASEILRHVVGHDYRDIGVVTGPSNSSASAARAESFIDTSREIGLPLPANRRFSAYLSEEGGRRLILRLIDEDNVPRALVCGSDAIASGVIGGLRANGYRVPEDVAVTGYDGVFPAASMLAELTTVGLPRKQMARIAVQQVIRRIEGVGGPVRDFLHPYRLRIGTSCGCSADGLVLPPRPGVPVGEQDGPIADNTGRSEYSWSARERSAGSPPPTSPERALISPLWTAAANTPPPCSIQDSC
jgi:LacI family transcriptional regulator